MKRDFVLFWNISSSIDTANIGMSERQKWKKNFSFSRRSAWCQKRGRKEISKHCLMSANIGMSEMKQWWDISKHSAWRQWCQRTLECQKGSSEKRYWNVLLDVRNGGEKRFRDVLPGDSEHGNVSKHWNVSKHGNFSEHGNVSEHSNVSEHWNANE